ncbi:MAG: hypothetical protein WD200_03545 [Candidatus Andersenbacteria bacterium]
MSLDVQSRIKTLEAHLARTERTLDLLRRIGRADPAVSQACVDLGHIYLFLEEEVTNERASLHRAEEVALANIQQLERDRTSLENLCRVANITLTRED